MGGDQPDLWRHDGADRFPGEPGRDSPHLQHAHGQGVQGRSSHPRRSRKCAPGRCRLSFIVQIYF